LPRLALNTVIWQPPYIMSKLLTIPVMQWAEMLTGLSRSKGDKMPVISDPKVPHTMMANMPVTSSSSPHICHCSKSGLSARFSLIIAKGTADKAACTVAFGVQATARNTLSFQLYWEPLHKPMAKKVVMTRRTRPAQGATGDNGHTLNVQ
jgi:hypothetical protein